MMELKCCCTWSIASLLSHWPSPPSLSLQESSFTNTLQDDGLYIFLTLIWPPRQIGNLSVLQNFCSFSPQQPVPCNLDGRDALGILHPPPSSFSSSDAGAHHCLFRSSYSAFHTHMQPTGVHSIISGIP